MEAISSNYTEKFVNDAAKSGAIVDSGTIHDEAWIVCLAADAVCQENEIDNDTINLESDNDFDFHKINESETVDYVCEGIEMCGKISVNCSENDFIKTTFKIDSADCSILSEEKELSNMEFEIYENKQTKKDDDASLLRQPETKCSNCKTDLDREPEHIDFSVHISSDKPVSDTIDETDIFTVKLEDIGNLNSNFEINECHFASVDLKSEPIETEEVCQNSMQQSYNVFHQSDVSGTGKLTSSETEEFDIGLLPYLINKGQEDTNNVCNNITLQTEHKQSLLDQRKMTHKKNSSPGKFINTSNCCTGCDAILKSKQRRKTKPQISKTKDKALIKSLKMKKMEQRIEERFSKSVLDVVMPDDILLQCCMECKRQITHMDHYRVFPRCFSCGFRTYCHRAFGEHMITMHGQMRANDKNSNVHFSTGFMECFCGVVYIDGNKMARHLVECEFGQLTCKATKLGHLCSSKDDEVNVVTSVKERKDISKFVITEENSMCKLVKVKSNTMISPVTKPSCKTFTQKFCLKKQKMKHQVSNKMTVDNALWCHNYCLPYWNDPVQKKNNIDPAKTPSHVPKNNTIRQVLSDIKDTPYSEWKKSIPGFNKRLKDEKLKSKLIIGETTLGDTALYLLNGNEKPQLISRNKNQLEQLRRKDLAKAFSYLYDILDLKYQDEFKTPAKIQVLEKSIKYVDNLKETLQKLENEKERLLQHQTSLKYTLEQLMKETSK